MKEKNKQDCEGGGNSSKRKLARHSVDWAVSTAPTAEQIGAICEQYDLTDEDSRPLQTFCEEFVPYTKNLQEEYAHVM